MNTQPTTNKHTTDIHRYSFSRFKTFHICPRKHAYQYIEQIDPGESPVTIPGKLFHKCIEQWLNNQPLQPIYDEFKKLCTNGELDLEPDLLEYIVTKYLQYYANDFKQERLLGTEVEYKETLDGEDYIMLVVDQVVEKDNLITVRDIKTTQNKLKYTFEDVSNNQQLMLYIPYVENDLKIQVDSIQIDEVRMAKLEKVPINNNGKPTADKRRLELVTYQEYFDTLESMGLETEPAYKPVLEWMQERGHPLFNRITSQLLDPNFVSANAEDMYNTYNNIRESTTDKIAQGLPASTYRIRGPLCRYCAYQQLCEQDMHGLLESERRILIDELYKNN